MSATSPDETSQAIRDAITLRDAMLRSEFDAGNYTKLIELQRVVFPAEDFSMFFGGTRPTLHISVGPGWWEPIHSLLVLIKDAVRDKPGVTFTITQLKEKFGHLRIYYVLDGAEDSLAYRINMLVGGCASTCNSRCEVCGEYGELDNRPWMKTLCPKHTQERKLR